MAPEWEIELHRGGRTVIRDDGKKAMTFRVQRRGGEFETAFVLGTNGVARTVNNQARAQAEYLFSQRGQAQTSVASLGTNEQAGFIGGMGARGGGLQSGERLFQTMEHVGQSAEEAALLGGPAFMPFAKLAGAVSEVGIYGQHVMEANRGEFNLGRFTSDATKSFLSGLVGATYGSGMKSGDVPSEAATRMEAGYNRVIDEMVPSGE